MHATPPPHMGKQQDGSGGRGTWKHGQESVLWEEMGQGSRLSRFRMGWVNDFSRFWVTGAVPVCVSLALR